MTAVPSRRILLLQLWPARAKAREAATAEAARLLADLGARPLAGGPLADRPGMCWVDLPTGNLPDAAERLPLLGYTAAVRVVVPADEARSGDERIRWRGRPHAVRLMYGADVEWWRRRAPDRRTFLLECGDGVVRSVAGYRGGRDPLSHRALPVHDARLLTNLVHRPGRLALIDPFAGAGSIVMEARDRGWLAISADVDPTLRHGLDRLGSGHVVADARSLPFPVGTFDAVATEPPYHASAADAVEEAMGELQRVLRPGCLLAMLVASDQRAGLVRRASRLGLSPELDVAVNRKGLPVTVLVWRR